jgi:flagellin
MASEMATYTNKSVLNQAATAMLAKANQQPQQVLSLLQG